MESLGVYLPEEHLRFKEFAAECDAVDRMAERVPSLLGGLSEPEAFCQAWVDEHPSPLGLSLFVGAEGLYGLVLNIMVLRAQNYCNYLRDAYLWKIAHNLRPHNAASNPVDPLRLLSLTKTGVGRPGTRVHRQVRWEAKQILAVAFGFTAMELAHPEPWIAAEVTCIDQLSSQRLFDQIDLVDVYVVYVVDKDNGGRVIGTPFVTLDERVAKRIRRRPAGVLPSGGRIFTHHFQCRTVVGDNGLRWLVENDDRRKTYFARLLKRHDGGLVRDSCGTSYVVVARLAADGSVAPGNREDVDAVHDLTESRLWSAKDLLRDLTPSKSKRHRHSDYWDRKLVGRIVMSHGGRRVHAYAEQILTSVTDYLNQFRATDALNHEIRRGEQLAIKSSERPDRIPPAWQYWPEDIYPKVRWSSDETIRLLRGSWARRFADRARKNV
jgi:hypothetical protein